MEDTTKYFALCAIENIAMMLCWTALAIFFNTWWIALFAPLCFRSVKVSAGKTTEEGDADG